MPECQRRQRVNATGSPRCVTAKAGICPSKIHVRNTFSCLCCLEGRLMKVIGLGLVEVMRLKPPDGISDLVCFEMGPAL